MYDSDTDDGFPEGSSGKGYYKKRRYHAATNLFWHRKRKKEDDSVLRVPIDNKEYDNVSEADLMDLAGEISERRWKAVFYLWPDTEQML